MQNKQRTTIWISPDFLKQLDRMSERANCRSRSEFIEKALRFYNGYLKSIEGNQYLPIALSSAMNGIIAKVLYKNTVELSQGVRCGMKLYEELKHIEIDSIQGKADFING